MSYYRLGEGVSFFFNRMNINFQSFWGTIALWDNHARTFYFHFSCTTISIILWISILFQAGSGEDYLLSCLFCIFQHIRSTPAPHPTYQISPLKVCWPFFVFPQFWFLNFQQSYSLETVADPELFLRGVADWPKGGPLQSCFSDSLYNQPNFPTKGGPGPPGAPPSWIRLDVRVLYSNTVKCWGGSSQF